jgi:hypothetical protein
MKALARLVLLALLLAGCNPQVNCFPKVPDASGNPSLSQCDMSNRP